MHAKHQEHVVEDVHLQGCGKRASKLEAAALHRTTGRKGRAAGCWTASTAHNSTVQGISTQIRPLNARATQMLYVHGFL